MSTPLAFELFHLLADPASARIRKLVGALGLQSQANFRNVHFETHAAALAAIGGAEVPAIWDSRRLLTGEQACEEFLRQVTPS